MNPENLRAYEFSERQKRLAAVMPILLRQKRKKAVIDTEYTQGWNDAVEFCIRAISKDLK